MGKIAPLFTWRSAYSSLGGPENPVTRHVLLAISLYMSEKGEGAFPSMEQLAIDTGMSVRTIKRHVPLAEELGWLRVIKKKGRGQGWKRNDYKAEIPPSYYEKMRQLQAEKHKEIDEIGGDTESLPQNNVVTLSAEGGDSECNNVVTQSHPNTPMNTPENTPSILVSTSGSDELPDACKFVDEAEEIAELLLESIIKWKPDHRFSRNRPSIKKWVLDIERAMRLDGRTKEQLEAIIRYTFNKSTRQALFWAKNVHSGEKLRDQYDKMSAAYKQEREQEKQRNNGYYGNNSNRKTKGDRAVEFLSR